MGRLKFIALLILIFSLTNCEKNSGLVNNLTETQLVNNTFDAQIVEFVSIKCYCCWGWKIKITNTIISSNSIPGLNPSENTVFPIDGKITIGSKTIDCSGNMADYYEIKDFTFIR
jgi:hypothetical protein